MRRGWRPETGWRRTGPIAATTPVHRRPTARCSVARAGAAGFEIDNQGSQPIVVKLREVSGGGRAQRLWPLAGPHGDGAAERALSPGIRLGELWSRACHGFAAGMRAQRFAVVRLAVGTVAAGDPTRSFRHAGAEGYSRRGVRARLGIRSQGRRRRCHTPRPMTACGSTTRRPAAGRAVIFVHEFAGDYRSWEPQMRHFAQRYRASPSTRAAGRRPMCREDVASYSQARAADDIRSRAR